MSKKTATHTARMSPHLAFGHGSELLFDIGLALDFSSVSGNPEWAHPCTVYRMISCSSIGELRIAESAAEVEQTLSHYTMIRRGYFFYICICIGKRTLCPTKRKKKAIRSSSRAWRPVWRPLSELHNAPPSPVARTCPLTTWPHPLNLGRTHLVTGPHALQLLEPLSKIERHL